MSTTTHPVHSYSMEELFLIAQKPIWIRRANRMEPLVTDQLPDDIALDHAVFIGEAVASAFVKLKPAGLRGKVRKSAHTRGPHRLVDLETIRTAKLKQPAALSLIDMGGNACITFLETNFDGTHIHCPCI